MQVMKVEVVIVDFDGLGINGIKEVIENARYPNHCMSPMVRRIEARDVGDWSDDNPLNFTNSVDAEIVRLFGE